MRGRSARIWLGAPYAAEIDSVRGRRLDVIGSIFPNHRLPEVFFGFSRSEYGVPVKYPVACHPQAWVAGAVPYMITATLGLRPQAFDRRLSIVRPILPAFVSHLEVFGLRVGDARVDLRFEPAGGGTARTEVLKVDGDLEIVIGEA